MMVILIGNMIIMMKLIDDHEFFFILSHTPCKGSLALGDDHDNRDNNLTQLFWL